VSRSVESSTFVEPFFLDHIAQGFAVASVERFRRLCAAKGIETPLNVQVPVVIEPTLFDISPN
jgi:hypothetical protein